ncbi:sulfite exporter TauE/SafE family protein [Candidatus Omnitrophota bacterium]
MSSELIALYITAASIGFFHTIFGPDHYLPFIVMKKARGWSINRTLIITLACGIGHILSSILLGAVGIFLGIHIMRLEFLESFRGNLAAWALIGFGFSYLLWGIRKAIQNKPHSHIHAHHDEGIRHHHDHSHDYGHIHLHGKKEKRNITPWVMFTIFVLGPCEPLIPILMYPASKSSALGVVMTATIFGFVTVSTMLGVVLVASYGISFVKIRHLERYSHALAGAAILFCGIAIQFLGL